MARRCGHCYKPGHNRRTCPSLKKYIQNNPDGNTAKVEERRKKNYSTRRCKYCGETGHNRRGCSVLKADKQKVYRLNSRFKLALFSYMKEKGIGVGTLVRLDQFTTAKRNKNTGLLEPDKHLLVLLLKLNGKKSIFLVGAEENPLE